MISAIKVAHLEFEVGLREDEPDTWGNWCEVKKCPGLEVVQGQGAYCTLRRGERCWHAKNGPVSSTL